MSEELQDEVAADPEHSRSGLTRRDLLAGAAGALGAAVLKGPFGVAAQPTAVPDRQETDALPTLPDPTSVLGRLPNELGERSPFVRPRRHASATSSRTPLQDLHGIITPSDVHFERHHGGVAQVDPRSYRLLIHGLVERPIVFTLEDLLRFPSESRIHFLECSGNMSTRAGPETPPQRICGLTSTSEWTGVPLSTLLREVGVRPEASWMIAEGQDAAMMARSIPVEKAWDDAMIAYGQNGEPLRPEQGYPVRLFLPGWEGNTNVKWLRRLEFTDGPLQARDETARYTDPLGDGTVRQFSFVMEARSIITTPSFPQRVEPGWNEIRGIAWSGRGKIAKVDISLDGGTSWVAADLQEPVLSKAHTRFRYMWKWDGSRAEIASRATDETGYVQPTRAQLIEARSARTSYHLNPITAWVVQSDGQVVYREEPWG